MSHKKKVTKPNTDIKPEELVVDEQHQPEPPEELPVVQVEESVVPTESEPVATQEVIPIIEKPKPLTMVSLHAEIEELRQIVEAQALIITQLQQTPIRQRKPVVSNGKVQIKDKLTGKIYPSKNNVYQSLLRAGELKELVDKGVFGAIPEKNSFGCYNLFRAYPDRFEEIKHEEAKV